MLRIGAMNMMTHGIDNPYIEYRDSLSDQNADKDKYTLVLANPPLREALMQNPCPEICLKCAIRRKQNFCF